MPTKLKPKKAAKGKPTLRETPMPKGNLILERTTEKLADLKPHPRNYRKHPPDQLAHIKESIRRHGLYRNVVTANDGTILAGHGVVEVCRDLGVEVIPTVRLNVGPEDPAALKVLTGDNEIGHLGEIDDRRLSEILKQIKETDITGLAGTGFDEMMLANLVFVTRPDSEIANFDAAAAWAGMPEYENGADAVRLVICFPSEKDRARFVAEKEIRVDKTAIKGTTWSTRWPWTDREDVSAIRFTTEKPGAEPENAKPGKSPARGRGGTKPGPNGTKVGSGDAKVGSAATKVGGRATKGGKKGGKP